MLQSGGLLITYNKVERETADWCSDTWGVLLERGATATTPSTEAPTTDPAPLPTETFERTAAGDYLFDKEVHSPDLSEHPDATPTCSEYSGSAVHRVDWSKQQPKVKYIKTGRRVLVGGILFDFENDDGRQVSASSLSGDGSVKVLT